VLACLAHHRKFVPPPTDVDVGSEISTAFEDFARQLDPVFTNATLDETVRFEDATLGLTAYANPSSCSVYRAGEEVADIPMDRVLHLYGRYHVIVSRSPPP